MRVGEAAAQFFENAAHPLHVDLARNLDREIIVEFASAQRPAQRIGRWACALRSAAPLAGAVVALPLAHLLLHLLRQFLRTLAHRLQRAALTIHRAFRVALAEPAIGIAHRAVGIGKLITVAISRSLALLAAGLSLLALLSLLLALFALLALPHAAASHLFLQPLQPVAQPLLILPQVTHVLIALLAARAIAP